MEVSDLSEQLIAYQSQNLQTALTMKLLKSENQQQQKMVDILTESAVQAATASANGRGTIVDIVV